MTTFNRMASMNTSPISVNLLTNSLVQLLIQQAPQLRLGTQKLSNGCTIIDAGISHVGGLEAGRLIAEICMGGLGHVQLQANNAFPHWFAPRYKTYNDNVQALPVDQHILFALLAPRPLYVASAEEDRWSDPNGEFLSAKAAEPVYALYGKQGLGAASLPSVNTSIGSTVSYHVRTGIHDVTAFDWSQFLHFADKSVK